MSSRKRVLVCGGRNWTNKDAIRRELSKLPPDTIIIEGECRGADRLAREVALELGLEVDPYPANWTRYGRAAGPIRNKEMLEKGRPTLVLAFHSDISKSKGTANMVKQALEADVDVNVFTS